MDYTKDFEAFWKQYPARWNQDLSIYVKRKKHPVFQKWQKLPKEIQDKCLRIVHLIKKAEGTPRDAVTWLNQQGWDDIEEPDIDAQSLPQTLTSCLKTVPQGGVNINNERNRQMKGICD